MRSRSSNQSAWISVLNYGADPTGEADSSVAVLAALSAAANLSSRADPSVGSANIQVSLEGGLYRIDSPLQIPGNSKGVSLVDGALVAGPGFKSSRHMIEVMPQPGTGTPTELAFTNLVLDAAHRGGCFRSDSIVQMTVQEVFFLHYSTEGILGSSEHGSGHELMVSKCFFAEYMWGEPGFNVKAMKTGTAVHMTYPDSHVIDSIIRCSRVGVYNEGGSNLFQGLHIYTTCDHGSDAANMTDGYIAAGSQQRFIDGYIDSCVARVKTFGGTSIQNTLFFGQGRLVLDPKRWSKSSDFAQVQGLIVEGNHFTCAGAPWGQACGNMTIESTEGVSLLPNAVFSSAIVDNNWANAPDAASTRPQGRAFLNATLAQLSQGPSGGGGVVVNVTLDQRFALPVTLAKVAPGATIGIDSEASPLRRVQATATSSTPVASGSCGSARVAPLVATPLSLGAEGTSMQLVVHSTCQVQGADSSQISVGVYVQADQST